MPFRLELGSAVVIVVSASSLEFEPWRSVSFDALACTSETHTDSLSLYVSHCEKAQTVEKREEVIEVSLSLE